MRKQAERQRLLYATLFLDPKLAETGRNTIFLRLHDDMCFNCYAPTIRELYKLEEQFDISLQAAGAYHYDATFRQTPAISNGEIVRPAMACLPEKRFLPTRR